LKQIDHKRNETKTFFPEIVMASTTEKNQELLDQDFYETSTDVKVVSSFDDMGLKEDLVRGIYAYSYRSSKFRF
jgi:hypothetical protein